jgi:hypothetical protein
VTKTEAYEQAAVCYRRAGYDWDAARCYQLAGGHRRAAEIYESIGSYAEAAAAYRDAGLPALGAWLLAHRAGLPTEAQAMLGGLAARPDGAPLRHRLILARCAIAEGSQADVIVAVVAEVRAALEDRAVLADPVAEEWAVAVSEAAGRYDQAALVFAAAVRGGRYGAAQRWNTWSKRVLDTEVILPPAPAAA